MRFLGVAVILAIVGVLLVSSGVAPVGPTIGQATAGPAPAADARPAGARLRPGVPPSRLEGRDTKNQLVPACALKSNGASSRTVTKKPPSASSSCSGCLSVGTAGRFAGF